MLNWIFLLLIAGAVLTGAFKGTMKPVTEASISSAKSAVELAIGLIGQMGLWLGFMRVLQDAGLMKNIANGLSPVMRRLFPEVPADHPAMGAMIMNLSANILGLGNAATPFGLKAMKELDKLNTRKGVATNSMALFLAINTSGVAVLPLGVIAVRATLGSTNAAGIVIPSILATMCSTLIGILAIKLLERRKMFAVENYPAVESETSAMPTSDKVETPEVESVVSSSWRLVLTLALWAAMVVAGVLYVRWHPASAFETMRVMMSEWLLPILMLFVVSIGFCKKVKIYESFIAGAKEAFQIAVTIIPFLLAIIVAIGIFRASGAMEAIIRVLSPITAMVGMPAETLPMAFLRPLSGSGAFAVMTETMKTYGADSLIGNIVSVINGSTETTFYVLAVYFGSVGIRAIRHTMAACLCADVVGIAASVILVKLLLF